MLSQIFLEGQPYYQTLYLKTYLSHTLFFLCVCVCVCIFVSYCYGAFGQDRACKRETSSGRLSPGAVTFVPACAI